MSEVILSITILLLLVSIAVSQYISIKEREKLMKLLMARNLQEVTDNEVMEKLNPNKETKDIPNDVQELSPDNDIAFDSMIKSELEVDPKELT